MKNIYFKKGITLIIFLLVLFCVYPSSNGFKQDVQILVLNDGNIFYVGGSGPGNYSSIQDAVDNAFSGDTVFVYDDSSPYLENIVVNKSIFLIGEDKNTVVIDGDFKDMVIKITADDVFVSGFTMIHPPRELFNDWFSALVDIVSAENVTIKDNIIQQNSWYYGDWNAGIIIRNSSYCFIQNNTISTEIDSFRAVGIAVIFGSTFNNVSGNEISGFTIGIYIKKDCTDNVIYMNYLHHNLEGIDISFSNNNIIINNIINFNNIGIWIEGCYNVVFGNIITDNGVGGDIDAGISIYSLVCADNYISYNHISNNNPKGILIISINNTITHNLISKNYIGVSCEYGYHNYITKNNFILNEKNGYFLTSIFTIGSRNFWRRNYWDEPRFLPYPVFGEMVGILNMFPWVNFDWFPALKPYDI